MEIASLKLQNFLTIGEAHLELDGRGLLLIQGINLDDTSTRSNGAGKSSIVDALSWAIYGETARNESGDDIVNDVAKKNTAVIVELRDGAEHYIIERYRKHGVFKNQLRVFAKLPDGTLSPLHKGSEKETQLVIDKIMGCAHDVFVGSIYAGQEKMPDLPGMTDKFLKLLVEEAAGVSELAEAYELTNKLVTAGEKNLAVIRTQLANAEQKVETARAAAAEAVEQRDLFESTRRDRAKEELKKVPPLKAEKQDRLKELGELNLPELLKRRDELLAKLDAHKPLQDQAALLQRAQAQAHATAEREKTTLLHLKRALDKAKVDLANVVGRIGTPCGECGKPYCEHDIEAAEKIAEKAVADAQIKQDDQAAKARAALADAGLAAKAFEDHVAKIPDVSVVSTEVRELASKISRAQSLEGLIAQAETQIKAVMDTAAAKLTEPNQWGPHVDARAEALRVAEADLAEVKAKATDIEDEYIILCGCQKVFGPAGVRAEILDTVTPFLNAQTADYLGALSDGNISATWSTLTRNAKGELKEKFSIQVENVKGGKKFGLQSGGEKRKVRLATALALQDLQASRATKPIGLFMADEIDDALDAPGLERLMGVLDRKARERGTVLVISHNALTDWIDNVITVTKENGTSRVEGAVVRS